MSKRTERRAAERAAHKAHRTELRAAAAAQTNPSVPSVDTVPEPDSAMNSFAPSTQAAAAAQPAFEPQRFTPEEEAPTLTQAEMDAMTRHAQALFENRRQQEENRAASQSRAASAAQINANRENAKSSTGPTSPAGREKVSQNRRTHGLLGRFLLLSEESPADYEDLTQSIYDEYAPQGDTETRLANSVIQHYWLMQRAIRLQEELMHEAHLDQKKLSLFMRYQSTHERSYYKAQKELQNLQKQKSKEQIGFVSQTRQQEAHEARVRLQHATAQRIETDTECRQAMEAPIPGTTRIGFEELTKACANAIAAVVYQNQFKTAAE
jgi:hypothetical protein